ncbi:hypothetical protein GCM10010300_14280 [Streptomyces olivaceoviridis]|nr:hypothetical protein GCM10010300_14280 [Streptomyces olivaceoviridis]
MPAGPDRTASPVPGFSTTAYVDPVRTATDFSISTRARGRAPADVGANGPVQVSPAHRVTFTVPDSRPFASITCWAVPQDPRTPANRISAASAPIAATRPNRNADTDA